MKYIHQYTFSIPWFNTPSQLHPLNTPLSSPSFITPCVLDGSVIAMACKDRTLRFMDLRCGQIVGCTQATTTTTDAGVNGEDGCTNSR